MDSNLEAIKLFVLKIQAHVPGEVKRLTVAIADGELDFEAWDNGDATLWNVVIGDRGSATFSVTEAKAADEATILRCAKDILGLSPEEKAAELMLEQVNRQLEQVARKRTDFARKEAEVNVQLAEKRAQTQAEEVRVRNQLEAAGMAIDAEEAHLMAYRDSLLRISAANGTITR